MIVSIFPDICPGQIEKLDHLELDMARFSEIKRYFNQIVHIFTDIYIRKKRKNEKSASCRARVGQMIVQIFPDICPGLNQKSESSGARFGSIRLDF